MSGPNCHNCIYSICDPEAWLRLIRLGEPVLPMCANHPQWPAQLHEVPGVPCKNYRRKPKVPEGDVRLIPLTDGLYAYVDAADYPSLSKWSWHITSGGYPARTQNHRKILMHREIMQPPKGKVVDHHDGNKANNCRFNLRVCNQKENRRNSRRQRRTRSGFKGVYYRGGRICSTLRIEGRQRWLGYFPDEVSAARAYDHAAVQECGDFAYVNFPQEWPPQRRRRVHAQYLRRTKSSSARECKKVGTKERKKDTHKDKTKVNGKKATRKPRPARRKTKKPPQRAHRGLQPQPKPR
jgi:hypothetical protein